MKKYIALFLLVAGFASAQPTLQSNAQIFGAKTYFRGGMTSYRGLTLSGNNAYTNLFLVSDSDSLKFRMFKYLYPIEMEIGNVQKFAVDSSGNAIFAGTVSASAFSPTATSTITAHEVFAVSDGDTVMLAPHQDTYPLKVGIGGARKFSVDSAGWTYATSFSTPTAALTAITGSATNATAVSSKLTIAADYPFVSNSTVTVDSLVTPRIAGVLGATEVKAKLTIADNYPLVSTSSIKADTLEVTAGNVYITDIDTVATAGGVSRWLRLTITKAGATGKPASYYMVSDTTSLY
jgi:hypothetical protein